MHRINIHQISYKYNNQLQLIDRIQLLSDKFDVLTYIKYIVVPDTNYVILKNEKKFNSYTHSQLVLRLTFNSLRLYARFHVILLFFSLRFFALYSQHEPHQNPTYVILWHCKNKKEYNATVNALLYRKRSYEKKIHFQ